MRHGERDGDSNTTFGLEQVAASVRLNLEGASLDAIYHSERERARQAATHAAGIVGYDREPVPHEAFFVDQYFEGQNGHDLDVADIVIGDNGTIEDLLRHWKAGEAARLQVQGGLIEIATEIAMLDPDQEEYYVLVGYHGPLTGIAALDPSTMPANTNYADMMCYELTDHDGKWTIAASVLLRCPLVKPA
jgi:hypothetical protein